MRPEILLGVRQVALAVEVELGLAHAELTGHGQDVLIAYSVGEIFKGRIRRDSCCFRWMNSTIGIVLGVPVTLRPERTQASTLTLDSGQRHGHPVWRYAQRRVTVQDAVLSVHALAYSRGQDVRLE